uniref:Uncharacterized protein n=1 Tax=Acrobeloides nanus TaxID=290746 RepID=A0A914DHW3_9BILA
MMSKWLTSEQLYELLDFITDDLYAGKDVKETLKELKGKFLSLHSAEQKAQLEKINSALDNAGLPVKSADIGNTVHDVLSNNFRAVLSQMSDFAVNCHENGLSKGATARHVYGLLIQFLTKRMSTRITCRLAARFQPEHWSVIKGHLNECFHFHLHDCSKNVNEDDS